MIYVYILHVHLITLPIVRQYHICDNDKCLIHMDNFVYAPIQWETMLHCNVVFHWLGAYTKWSLDTDQTFNSQKTLHSLPMRASYGVSFVSVLEKNDHIIRRSHCTGRSCYYLSLFVKSHLSHIHTGGLLQILPHGIHNTDIVHFISWEKNTKYMVYTPPDIAISVHLISQRVNSIKNFILLPEVSFNSNGIQWNLSITTTLWDTSLPSGAHLVGPWPP